MYNLRDAVVMFNGETGEVLVTENHSDEFLERRDLPSCDWANEDYWASISAEEMHYRMYQEFHYLLCFNVSTLRLHTENSVKSMNTR